VSAFIEEHRERFGVEPICETLGVSASAYYQRATGQRSARQIDDERVAMRIHRQRQRGASCWSIGSSWMVGRWRGRPRPPEPATAQPPSGSLVTARRGRPGWLTAPLCPCVSRLAPRRIAWQRSLRSARRAGRIRRSDARWPCEPDASRRQIARWDTAIHLARPPLRGGSSRVSGVRGIGQSCDHHLHPGVDQRLVIDLGWDAEDVA
jgi:hypothetical protein